MRFEVNLSILFTELPLLDRPAAARQAGFDAVEFWWPWPVAVPVGRRGRPVRHGGHRRRRAAGRAQLLRGRHGRRRPRPRVLAGPQRRVPRQHRRHGRASASGSAAGRSTRSTATGPTTARPAEQDALAAENLALAARAAQRIGGTVLVEPVSGAPRYPLLTAADALAAIDRARRGATSRCCCDVYHLAVNGDDVDAAIDGRTRAGSGTSRSPTPRAATSPAPGSSTSTATCDRIAATGYDGWVGLEYKPTGASADAFDWLPRERRSAR